MKILPLVNGIKKDMHLSEVRLKTAATDGYNIGCRTAKIYKQNRIRKYLNITRSISGKVIKGTTKDEIPYLAGALGMMLPIPLTSPIFLGLGLIIRFSIPDSVFLDDSRDNEENSFNEYV